MILWFTGQPGSGKTTLCDKLKDDILYSYYYLKHKIIHLDGDDTREILDNKDYSEAGRRKNIQFTIDMARVLSNKGFLVLCSFVSPYRDMRENLKSQGNVAEFYLKSKRDLRKEYWVDNYEPPLENFTQLDTDKPIKECIDEILNVYRTMAALSRRS
mgnify:FL=1